MTAARKTRDLEAEIAFLTRALKAPTLRESVERLAERARAETWSHEEFLVACLATEIAAPRGPGALRAAQLHRVRQTIETLLAEPDLTLRRVAIARITGLGTSADRDGPSAISRA